MPSNTSSAGIGRYIGSAIMGLIILIGTTSNPAPEFKVKKDNPNPDVVKNIQVWADTGGQLGAFRTNGVMAISGAFISGGVTIGTGSSTVTAGQGLTKTASSLKVNATLTGTTVIFTTVSGSTLRYGALSPGIVGAELFASGSVVTTGSGKLYMQIPETQSGFKIFHAKARVGVAGTTNSTTIQLRNADKGDRKIFGTPVTIPTGTTVSDTTYTITAGNNDVGGGDRLWVDIPAVSTTAPKILSLILQLYKP